MAGCRFLINLSSVVKKKGCEASMRRFMKHGFGDIHADRFTLKLLWFALILILAIVPVIWSIQGVQAIADSEPQSFPCTITDDLGRKVKISAPPKRIVSIAPSNTEILYALGVSDKIVGVTTACDYPSQAKQKEKVGGAELNFEKIVALSPDVVFAVASLQKTAIEKLERLGITVVAVDPQTLDDVARAMELIGRASGADPNKVKEVVDTFRQRKNRVESSVSKQARSKKVRVFVEIWNKPLMTAGPGTFIDEIIRLAGGENIAFDAKNPWPQFSEELVIQRDPEVILLTGNNLEEVMGRATWRNISAVKNRRVYEINPDILVRPGPRLVDGLEEVARCLRDIRASQ
ncbi:MAG TPA: cobalamin-binding protein [Firmicutes bacterium]|nr:cobalamin-binding protein [Bacillota bacterium]HHY98088.1 cobalamin-binding protein [Bacillota bacterium]